MKKMVLGLFVALSVGVLHGSAVNWTASNLPTGNNALVYAFTGSTAQRDAIIALFASETYKVDFVTYLGDLANSETEPSLSIGANSHVALGRGAQPNSGGVTGGTLGNITAYESGAGANSFIASTSQSVFFLVFNAQTLEDASSFSVSVLNTQTLGTTGTKTYTTSWNNWGGTGVAGTWTPLPVPEPTSVALLALGVAAVGLRRRFRK